jgi:signal transduction histidine kinase
VESLKKQNRIEWIFLAAMIVLCAILTAMQYRWTGEVARAEMERLRANIEAPAQQLCRAFDAELADACTQLLPTAAEVDAKGREAAHLDRFRNWIAAGPRPIFSRVAIAVRAGNTLELMRLGAEATPIAWPDEWRELRDNLVPRIASPGGPRFESRDGMLIEFPVFGAQRTRGGANIGWLVLELDRAYLRDVWLPELVKRHLQIDGDRINDIVIKTADAPMKIIYATASESAATEAQASVRFNRSGRSGDEGGRWILEVHQRPGVLETIVSTSRRRNLAIALLLNALMLGAGVLLVRHTRRSRELADTQMKFVANVSHELRTPLTVIRGAAHNLQRGVVQEPERIAQYSGLIIQHTEQLTDMVEQILALAGAQRSSAMQRQPVSLIDVVNDAVAATAPETQAAQCTVEWQPPAKLPTIAGDAAALRRVFGNLISNATKHAREGRWIGISAASSDHQIVVEVRDRGPGIPEAEQAMIFDPFVRGERAQATQVRGTGLGLSLVREIVEAHGGSVSVRNENGAVFTVKLPVT